MKNIYKLCITIGAYSSLISFGTYTRADELIDAIKNNDVAGVELFLYKHDALDSAYKKDIEKIAQAYRKQSKLQTKALVDSGYDIGRCVGGACGVLAGLCGIKWGLRNVGKPDYPESTFKLELSVAALSALGSIAGSVQLYKGWNLTSAYTQWQKAAVIKALISQKETVNLTVK
jgi:hypothetical protein